MRHAVTYRGARRNIVRATTGIQSWRSMGYTQTTANVMRWVSHVVDGVRKTERMLITAVQQWHKTFSLTEASAADSVKA